MKKTSFLSALAGVQMNVVPVLAQAASGAVERVGAIRSMAYMVRLQSLTTPLALLSEKLGEWFGPNTEKKRKANTLFFSGCSMLLFILRRFFHFYSELFRSVLKKAERE